MALCRTGRQPATPCPVTPQTSGAGENPSAGAWEFISVKEAGKGHVAAPNRQAGPRAPPSLNYI